MTSPPFDSRPFHKKSPATRAWARFAWRLVYLAAVTAILYYALAHWGYDDPYITYRYAKNIASGVGFVYNAGEHVQSTTTPLFALVLAGLSFLWNDLPHLANLISAFSIALGAVILWDLAQCWQTPWAGWTALLIYPFFPLLLTTTGSETPLYLTLCLAAFLFYARHAYLGAGVLAALAVLARPDGLLVPALIAIHYLFASGLKKLPEQLKKIPWGASLAFAVILGAWFLFAWAYFGSPLPLTLAAKQHQGEMEISQRFFEGFGNILRDHARLPQYWGMAVLALAGLIYLLWRARAWGLVVAWTAAYFSAYSLLGVSRYYWYYAPLVPGFVGLVGLGVQALWAWLAGPPKVETSRTRPKPWRHILQYSPAILILVIAGLQASNAWTLHSIRDPRLQTYRQVGEWLKTNTPEGATLGALEIGVIGYYGERPIVDYAGLLQPETTEQLRQVENYDQAALWVHQRYHPQVVVVQQNSLPGLESHLQNLGCQAVASFAAEDFGTRQPLWVYACR